MQPDTPSAAPVPVRSNRDARFIPDGREVPAASGWQWIAGGWTLFLKQPVMWIVLAVGFAVILSLVTWVPLVGGAAGAVLTPILIGGLMIGCRNVDEGRGLEIEHLFAGFRQGTQQLAVVGVFHLLAYVVILVVIGAIVGVGMLTGGMMGATTTGMPGMVMGTAAGGMMSMLLAGLIGAALAVPVYAAMWFAPALIVFQGTGAVAALKASFFAVLKNILPMLVNGAILLVLAFIASIPFGLGLLVLAPVMVASVYVAYRELFFAPVS